MQAPDATSAKSGAARRELVLVGAGHAHVQILRRWMMSPVPGVRLSCIVDRSEAVYSGMVPGCVAGDYRPHELEIDVVPLARRAGAALVLAAATRIDPVLKRIEVAGRPPLRYDVASLDVGSTVFGLELPGVREHALATRPIREFIDAIERGDSNAQRGTDAPEHIAIVGGGAAGIEVAFTLRARFAKRGSQPKISVVCGGEDILTGYTARVRAALRREAQAHQIEVQCGARVVRVERDRVCLENGAELSSELTVWATGAAPLEFLIASPLPHDERGFVRVASTLEVEGTPGLFAVGDCASLSDAPWLPKAGVYAVREGPVLDANLRRALQQDDLSTSGGLSGLRSYRPQRDFLTLINLGEQRALAAKWGVCATGRAAYRVKDWIDRRFVQKFQVLSESGNAAPAFPRMSGSAQREMDEMPCGGCAAKVGASPLAAALSRMPVAAEDKSVELGLAQPDDAALVRIGDSREPLLATVDGFRAFTDDPWLVGRVATINALSDIYAKGGQPRHALALVTVPNGPPAASEETLAQVMFGIREELDRAGTTLIGGHTTVGPELFVALTVTGSLPKGEPALALGALRPGDALLLTKALGTGVLLAADMRGLASGRWLREAHTAMTRNNAASASLARRFEASACTDISGFGLFGHLCEMLRASRCNATLRLASVPSLAGADELLASGLRSSAHDANREGRRAFSTAAACRADSRVDLLFDPQSAGGLLFGVRPDRAEAAVAALHDSGEHAAAIIGYAQEAPGGDCGLVQLDP